MISGRPKRWEVAVFHFPGEPSQAYVKRVVGLPGESIRIKGGDIFVDGKIVRKSLAEIRAMRILVHDSRFQPQDAKTLSALANSRPDRADPLARERLDHRGWPVCPHGRDHESSAAHRLARLQALGSVAAGDMGRSAIFTRYNGGDLRADNEVADLGVEARMCVSEAVDVLSLALRSGSDQFVVRIPVGRRGSIELSRNNQRMPLKNCWNPFEE